MNDVEVVHFEFRQIVSREYPQLSVNTLTHQAYMEKVASLLHFEFSITYYFFISLLIFILRLVRTVYTASCRRTFFRIQISSKHWRLPQHDISPAGEKRRWLWCGIQWGNILPHCLNDEGSNAANQNDPCFLLCISERSRKSVQISWGNTCQNSAKKHFQGVVEENWSVSGLKCIYRMLLWWHYHQFV